MNQITDYASLQTTAAGMIHRPNDTNITNNLPLFVQLCEAELNDRLLLRDSESDEAITLTAGNNYAPLPTGYVSPIALWLVLSGYRTKLTPVLPQELAYNISSSIPEYWAIDGDNIRFDCPLAAGYSAFLRCVKKSNLDAATNTTNYLLLKRPDIYLYGTLKQVAIFTNDDEALQKYGTLYEAGIARLKAAENRNRGIVHLRTDLGAGRRSSILQG
jgi:hypothetical protein